MLNLLLAKRFVELAISLANFRDRVADFDLTESISVGRAPTDAARAVADFFRCSSSFFCCSSLILFDCSDLLLCLLASLARLVASLLDASLDDFKYSIVNKLTFILSVKSISVTYPCTSSFDSATVSIRR